MNEVLFNYLLVDWSPLSAGEMTSLRLRGQSIKQILDINQYNTLNQLSCNNLREQAAVKWTVLESVCLCVV